MVSGRTALAIVADGDGGGAAGVFRQLLERGTLKLVEQRTQGSSRMRRHAAVELRRVIKKRSKSVRVLPIRFRFKGA